jgi:acyl carrier protein
MTNLDSAQTETEPQAHLTDEKRIELWIIDRVARELAINPAEIDAKATFSRYGLDSVAAVQVVSDLEGYMSMELSPTLPYEYPTAEELATYLSSVRNAKA